MIEAAALTSPANYFEDFIIGDVYEHARGKTVEGLENVLITNLVMNTAQGHFNEHYGETLPQKHRIVFGGVTAAIVIGLAMQDTGEQAVAEIGLDKVRFRVPVLHGDTLYAFTEVLGKDEHPADSRGYRDVGLAHFRHWGVNQRGETVFEGERRVLLKKRAFTAAGSSIAQGRAAPSKRRVTMRSKALNAKAARSKQAARLVTKPASKSVRKGRTGPRVRRHK
jgi:acyl dehydratase